MNFLLNLKTYRFALLLFCTILFQQYLSGQKEVFILPVMNGYDTFKTMESAARKWFDLNRKSASGDEEQIKYISCKRFSPGIVVVIHQRTWVNRAGSGGADKPEKVTDDPYEETTSIAVAEIEDEVKVDEKPTAVAALKAKSQKEDSRSNFSQLANIPTPSPASMSAINARITEMASTFVDITRDPAGNTKISRFEAESAAILESSFNLKIRALKNKEKGDFAVESGTITTDDTTVDMTGKTVDQMGIPAAAVTYFKLKEFTASIKAHFSKAGVNFILLDVRHLSITNKGDIKEFLITNHSKDLQRLITIGF